MLPFVTAQALWGAKVSRGYALQGFHLLGELLDVCQVMGILMKKHLGSRAEVGVQSLAHPTFDFLRTRDVMACHEGGQTWRIAGRFYPLCDSPLPRPAD